MNYMSTKFKGAKDIFVIFMFSLNMDTKLQMLYIMVYVTCPSKLNGTKITAICALLIKLH
jgi:hypothetical protein